MVHTKHTLPPPVTGSSGWYRYRRKRNDHLLFHRVKIDSFNAADRAFLRGFRGFYGVAADAAHPGLVIVFF